MAIRGQGKDSGTDSELLEFKQFGVCPRIFSLLDV